MIRILITAVLYLISFFSQAQDHKSEESKTVGTQLVNVNTTINQMSSDKGTVYFALFDSAENFEQRKFLQVRKVKASENGVHVTFNNVAEGEYAITCFHDENDNQTMDFDLDGMPLENYGSSNNVMNFGPPRFDDAKFVVNDKDLTFEIKF